MPTSLARGCTRPCPRTATRACRRCFASSTPWEYVSVSNLAASARAPGTAPAREQLHLGAILRMPNEQQVDDEGAPWTECRRCKTCWRSPGAFVARPRAARALAVGGALGGAGRQTAEAGEQQIELGRRNLARAFFEQRPVERDDLRRVRDRVFRQPCHPGSQPHVARRVSPPKIAWHTAVASRLR